jgi:hypothetical protein
MWCAFVDEDKVGEGVAYWQGGSMEPTRVTQRVLQPIRFQLKTLLEQAGPVFGTPEEPT